MLISVGNFFLIQGQVHELDDNPQTFIKNDLDNPFEGCQMLSVNKELKSIEKVCLEKSFGSLGKRMLEKEVVFEEGMKRPKFLG